jgi:hypothetical protein
MTNTHLENVKRGLRLAKTTLRRLDLSATPSQPRPDKDRPTNQQGSDSCNTCPGPGHPNCEPPPPPKPRP